MTYYYNDGQMTYLSEREDLPLERLSAPPSALDSLCVLFERPPLFSRAVFRPSHLGQLLQAEEGVHWLDSSQLEGGEDALPPLVRELFFKGGLRCANVGYPQWQSALARRHKTKNLRVNLLALGDVGSTLLLGLKLLGGGVIEHIGIFDLDPKVSARWEMEMGQIHRAWDYDALPRITAITQEELFDCDAFLFCASAYIPPVGQEQGDVRMAQLSKNKGIVAHYAKLARKEKFQGLFCVVSDPVDPLCKAALLASNEDGQGGFDGAGLLPEQVQGFGLGVMNARAAYYAQKDSRFAAFLSEGRAFGPHGGDLVIANSIANYDDALSKELTGLAVRANLQMREIGFKPYVAPAISSGALSILGALKGEWHYGSVYFGGIFMGVKNRFTELGLETEALPLPPALYARIEQAALNLKDIV